MSSNGLQINEKIMNAVLPSSVYRLCPDVPIELQQPNFKPIDYVNSQLKDKQFNSKLLQDLIGSVDDQIKHIDAEIEKIICDDTEVELPDIQKTTDLFNNLKSIQKQVEETQTSSSVFIEKMNRFNQARKQIDFLAMNIECCKKFQDLVATFPLVFPTEVQQLQQFIKPFTTASCIQQYLLQLQDIPQLADSFTKYNTFYAQVKTLKPQSSHVQDPFQFWLTYQIKFGFCLGCGEQNQMLNDVCQTVFDQGFGELQGENKLTDQFVNRFETFYQIHRSYLASFQNTGINEVLEGRQGYYEILQNYGQGRTTAVHKLRPELYEADRDVLEANNNFQTQFYQNFALAVSTKLNSVLKRYTVEELVKSMLTVQRLEQILTQDQSTTIQQGQLSTIYSEYEDKIVSYVLTLMETYTQKEIFQQLQVLPKKIHIQLYDECVRQLQKLQAFLDFIPGKITPRSQQLINQKITELITQQILPLLEKRLNFTQFVSQQIEKQTKFFTNNKYANFGDLYSKAVQPLIQLETFKTQTLMPVDFSESENAPLKCCLDLVKVFSFIQNVFFTQVLTQLSLKGHQEPENLFEFSDAGLKYESMFVQALYALIVGQFVGTSFYQPQQRRLQALNLARDELLASYKLVEQELMQFFDEEWLETFELGFFSTFMEHVGGFVTGGLVQLVYDDYAQIKKVVEQISQEFSCPLDAQVRKLTQIIMIKTMKCENKEIDRQTFKQLMGDVQDSAKYYDEVVTGYVKADK